MTRGLVVGKFIPPHAGHHQLIEFAQRHCDQLTVAVCDRPTQRPSGYDRVEWLQTIHPDVDVIVAGDVCAHPSTTPCEPACSTRWADHIVAVAGHRFDVVISSETYGELFASELGADHVTYDPARTRTAVSGTAVRDDLAGNWGLLYPVVQAGLHRRVVIMGAESTGTTTLARDVAVALGAPVTVEAGRVASRVHAAAVDGIEHVTWTAAMFSTIIDRQRQLEAGAAFCGQVPGKFGPWVVCDTDIVASVAWWERYVTGISSAALEAHALNTAAELYVVTSPDGVEFVADGIRDGEHVRESMHRRFCELADATGRPWCLAVGSPAQRVQTVLDAIDDYSTRHPLFIT